MSIGAYAVERSHQMVWARARRCADVDCRLLGLELLPPSWVERSTSHCAVGWTGGGTNAATREQPVCDCRMLDGARSCQGEQIVRESSRDQNGGVLLCDVHLALRLRQRRGAQSQLAGHLRRADQAGGDLLAEIDLSPSEIGPGVLVDDGYRPPVQVPRRIDDGPEIEEGDRKDKDRHHDRGRNPDRADLEGVRLPQRGASLRRFGVGHPAQGAVACHPITRGISHAIISPIWAFYTMQNRIARVGNGLASFDDPNSFRKDRLKRASRPCGFVRARGSQAGPPFHSSGRPDTRDPDGHGCNSTRRV
jgi:hypothetical protein